MNQDNLNRFMVVYVSALASAAKDYPEEYGFPPEQAPIVAERMRAAFERGSYNHDGRAIKAACKALGIKHTRTAMETFFKGDGK